MDLIRKTAQLNNKNRTMGNFYQTLILKFKKVRPKFMRMKMRGLVELNQIINTDLHNINHKTQS